MHARVLSVAFALAATVAAALPAAAQSTLPEPAVVRVPTTFGGAGVAPRRQIPGEPTLLDRYNKHLEMAAQRHIEQMAFEKKFGQGTPVKLRARRY